MGVLIRFLYTIRYGVAALLMLVGVNYLLSEPTRVIVNSTYFVTVIYSIAIFSWLFIKRLFPFHYLLILLWLVIPYVYLELVQFRFNGGIDASYDTLYWLSSWLLVGQGLLWLFSLYPLSLLSRPLVNKQQNRKIKQDALDSITEQIVLENRQPDDSHKACVMGLYQLQEQVGRLPLDCNSGLFRQNMLAAMRNQQKTFTSEFIDDYNSAKASMGSAIINIEKSWDK